MARQTTPKIACPWGKPRGGNLSSLCWVLVLLLLAMGMPLTSAADPAKVQRHIVEFPSQAPGLNCEATRAGLVCRLSLAESVAYGGRFELQVVAAEAGEWKAPQLKVGKLLKVTPEPVEGAKPKPAKSGDKLSFEWNFNLDPNAAEKLFEREMKRVTAAVEAQAKAKNLTGTARAKYIEGQLKEVAMNRADLLMRQTRLLELDELRDFKTRKVAEQMLAEKKLSGDESERVIRSLFTEDIKQIEVALRSVPEVKEDLNKITDANVRAKKSEELAQGSLDAMREQRNFVGWASPGFLNASKDGVVKLKRICEWQAAELLFLQTHFDLDTNNTAHWMALSAELKEWLLTGTRSANATTRQLRDADIERLSQELQARYDVEFIPWVADQKADLGWTAAHRVTLKADVVGSVIWKSRTGQNARPYAAWLKVDAPAGVQCDLTVGAKELTWCVVQQGSQNFVRIAPRQLGASVDFEARVHHPQIRGSEIRWTPPAPPATVGFPF